MPNGSSVCLTRFSLVDTGNLGNYPQPPTSVTGFGENPGEWAGLQWVVGHDLPLIFVVVASRMDCICAYPGKPSTPPPPGWLVVLQSLSTI